MVGTEVVRPLFSGQIASLGSRLCAGSEYRFTIRRRGPDDFPLRTAAGMASGDPCDPANTARVSRTNPNGHMK